MPKELLKNKEGEERLKAVKHKGHSILICDFSDCSRDEGIELLALLVARLQEEAEGSVRLLLNTANATHDATQTNEWKRHLELFNSRLKKSAVIGMSPLNTIALAGIRMYGRLMGQDKAVTQTQVFDSREAALDYLGSEN